MDKFIKLKAVAILVCSGVAGGAMADTSATMNNTTNGNQPQSMATQAAMPDDAAITSSVNAALSEYAGKVTVSVKGGVVYLSGELASDTDYEKVITLAESTKGVSDVNVDKLTVKDSKQPLQDTYITAKVKGALIRSDIMGKDVPAWSLSVETKNGEVFLSGEVASQEQKQQIIQVVEAVKGVKNVNDKMVMAAPAPDSATDTTDAGAADKAGTADQTDVSDQTDTSNDTQDSTY